MNLALLLLATAVAYAAAYNRSRPPALLLASLLLALSVLSLVLPKLMLTRLTLRRRLERVAQVGQSLALDVEVRNDGWLPRMMVDVEDTWRARSAGSSPEHATGEPDMRLGLGLVAWLGPRARTRFVAHVPCTRRGAWSLGPAKLVCAYPLGLVQASRSEAGPAQTLLVYPKLFPVSGLPLAGSVLEPNRDELPLRQPHGADEFAGLREYRSGDALKHVDWRASARRQELLVREFEPAAGARLCLALDLQAESDVGVAPLSTTETAISMAASVSRWAARKGLALRVCTTTEEPPAPPVRDGELGTPETTDPLLTWFATLSARRTVPYSQVLLDVATTTHQGETVLAFVSCDETGWPAVLGALLEVKEAGAALRVFVLDRDAFQARAADPGGQADSGAVLTAPPGSSPSRAVLERCAQLQAWGLSAVHLGPATDLEGLFR